jgi:hypothetical protein
MWKLSERTIGQGVLHVLGPKKAVCLLVLVTIALLLAGQLYGVSAAAVGDTGGKEDFYPFVASAVGVPLVPAEEGAGLCPVAALVHALGGRVEKIGEGRLVASLPLGELKLVRGERRAEYGGEERILASLPVEDTDGFYLAPPELAGLFGIPVATSGEEAVFLVPSEEEGLRLVEARTYADGPAWYLVGRVGNRGQLAQELVRITWEVGNAAGEVVATAAGYINFLNPGETKAFKLVLPFRADAAWYRLKLAAGFPAKPRELMLTAGAEQYNDRPAAYLSLKGRVCNQGMTGYDFLKVVVEFYNGARQLVDVDSVFLTCLDPGSSRAFTVYTPRVEEAVSWQIKFD